MTTTDPKTTSSAMEECRARFLEALKIRHCSPATVKSWTGSLNVFFDYLGGRGVSDVREINRPTIEDYQRWLQKRSYAALTVISRMEALRRFFEYLEATDQIFLNPCAGVALPRLARRLPKAVLTEQEAQTVLEAPDTQRSVGIRNRAILETFYSTGIRLEETARLNVDDVDCRNGFVRVNKGKGANDRMVPLGRAAAEAVAEYLEKIRSGWTKGNQEQRALWLSCKAPHGPLKSQAIAVMVKHYGRQVGIKKSVTPHVWRHTCATHLVADGANIAYVQRLLGHRSIRTTQIYTRTTIAEIKATHARAHPRGGEKEQAT